MGGNPLKDCWVLLCFTSRMLQKKCFWDKCFPPSGDSKVNMQINLTRSVRKIASLMIFGKFPLIPSKKTSHGEHLNCKALVCHLSTAQAEGPGGWVEAQPSSKATRILRRLQPYPGTGKFSCTYNLVCYQCGNKLSQGEPGSWLKKTFAIKIIWPIESNRFKFYLSDIRKTIGRGLGKKEKNVTKRKSQPYTTFSFVNFRVTLDRFSKCHGVPFHSDYKIVSRCILLFFSFPKLPLSCTPRDRKGNESLLSPACPWSLWQHVKGSMHTAMHPPASLHPAVQRTPSNSEKG